MVSVATLVASLALDTAGFVTGSSKATQSLKGIEDAGQHSSTALSGHMGNMGKSASGAASEMEKAGHSAQEAGGKFGGLSEHAKGLGEHFSSLIGPLAAVGVGIGGLVEVKGAIDAFSELAGNVKKLQVITGDTAENSSKMIFAFQEKGVAAETVTKSMGKLEKALMGVVDAENDGMMPAGKSMVKLVDDLGVSLAGTDGHTRAMNDVVLDLADKFHELGPGAESTALAMKLFGKAGADMLPALLMGKEGMMELEKESDKLGHTLSKQEIDAFKNNSKATKEWHAALEGIQIQLGSALMPIMARATEVAVLIAVALNQKVVPAIKEASAWIDAKLIPAIEEFVKSEFIPMLIKAGIALKDTIVPAVVEFAAAISGKLNGPLQKLMDLMGGKEDMLKAFAVVIGVVLVGAVTAYAISMGIAAVNTVIALAPIIAIIAAVALLAAGVYLLVKHWDDITAKYPQVAAATEKLKDGFQAFVEWLKGPFAEGAMQVYKVTSEAVTKAITFVVEHWDEIKAPFIAFGLWIVSDFLPAAKKVYDVIAEWVKKAIDFVRDNWDEIKAPFVAFGTWVATVYVPFWILVYSTVFDYIKKAVAFVHDHWDEIKVPFVAFGTWVATVYVPFWVLVYSTIYDYIKKAIDFVVTHWDEIKAPFVAFGTWVATVYVPFWVAVYTAVFENIKKAVDFVVDNWPKVQNAISGAWGVIKPIIESVVAAIQTIINVVDDLVNGAGGGIGHMLDLAGTAFDDFKNIVLTPINTVRDAIQAVIDLAGKVGGAIDAALHAGGDLNPLNHFADGSMSTPSGLALVGEHGPELVAMPGGARVYTNAETRALASAPSSAPQSGGNNGGLNINGPIHFHTSDPDGGMSALENYLYEFQSRSRARGLA